MGNLRDKYTDEEWNEMVDRIEAEKKNGKPDDIFQHISVYNKNVDELIKLKTVLLGFYSEGDLYNLNRWIAWKSG